jgi:serine O-acetyltransferase
MESLIVLHQFGFLRILIQRVVGATAVIGKYCILTYGNVIGRLYGTDDRPTIGDYFFAGTGTKILGKIRIGNHVHVGANAVIVNTIL